MKEDWLSGMITETRQSLGNFWVLLKEDALAKGRVRVCVSVCACARAADKLIGWVVYASLIWLHMNLAVIVACPRCLLPSTHHVKMPQNCESYLWLSGISLRPCRRGQIFYLLLFLLTASPSGALLLIFILLQDGADRRVGFLILSL